MKRIFFIIIILFSWFVSDGQNNQIYYWVPVKLFEDTKNNSIKFVIEKTKIDSGSVRKYRRELKKHFKYNEVLMGIYSDKKDLLYAVTAMNYNLCDSCYEKIFTENINLYSFANEFDFNLKSMRIIPSAIEYSQTGEFKESNYVLLSYFKIKFPYIKLEDALLSKSIYREVSGIGNNKIINALILKKQEKKMYKVIVSGSYTFNHNLNCAFFFPKKSFYRNMQVFIQPFIISDTDTIYSDDFVVLQGEKVKDNNIIISYNREERFKTKFTFSSTEKIDAIGIKYLVFNKKLRKPHYLNINYNVVNNHVHIDSELFNNTKVLNLSYASLSEIPTEIYKLNNLKELYLFSNNLTFVSPEIKKLQNLKKLDLYDNNLTTLPYEINSLKKLKEINIRRNPIITLPNELKDFLHSLDICYTDMPLENYFNTGLITKLNWSSMNLSILPPEIWTLENLTKLNLRWNNLTTLSVEIGNLQNLSYLDLRSNDLTTLPAEIGKLKSLTHLYLGENNLTTLPAEIGNLRNLTKLDLSTNYLTTLPAEIGQLSSLTKLYLHDNNLITLPQEIGNLTNLTEFSIDWQNLDSLPAEILNLNCFSGNDWFYMARIFAKNQEYENAVQVWKKAIKYRPYYYNYYYNLSWYLLFVNKPQEAINAAQKTLELNPNAKGVYTNLVLGYVLNNEFDKAKPIYLEWKDKHFPNDDRLAKEVFLQDIADLEAAGIHHKDFEKVRQLLK